MTFNMAIKGVNNAHVFYGEWPRKSICNCLKSVKQNRLCWQMDIFSKKYNTMFGVV